MTDLFIDRVVSHALKGRHNTDTSPKKFEQLFWTTTSRKNSRKAQ